MITGRRLRRPGWWRLRMRGPSGVMRIIQIQRSGSPTHGYRGRAATGGACDDNGRDGGACDDGAYDDPMGAERGA